ncbi:uncharacterized protein LAESUDRAFT_652023 [Laetiporus sulphureus 93-53]|uniref:Uncharacterized protein n=1 Tax=Laetiporus sulphureus 93-53 TaxID=1314785 RepID=A0A165EG29_9APHY|nr:uncharacterized protein LAESUDRAFT_652023 [Laetiporus sulphureus 93-53]KZT06985.1 hypothetical protein LAESUDRAFT_652023 [Laetiporus sulphureus 93-53]
MAPTYAPCPRPILKRPSTVPAPDIPAQSDASSELLAIDRGILTPLVRFPPRPSLARTFSAYSSQAYDRSPIVVQPNRCALPERGCPGRTYAVGDPAAASSPSRRTRSPTRGRHLHPRAVRNVSYRERERDDEDDEDDDPTPRGTPLIPALPALVPDLSSESDESDGFTSPPTEPAPGMYAPALRYAWR